MGQTVYVWRDLERELDLWGKACARARFWVRDDDASKITPQLERLDQLATSHGIQIGLAVIPALLSADFITYLNSGAAPFFPMCHGWDHANHGVQGKPSEFGPERPLGEQLQDLERARAAFCAAFHIAPVFVPPYDNIAPSTAEALPSAGFAALSCAPSRVVQRLTRLHGRFAWLPALPVSPPLPVRSLDVHVDPVDWYRDLPTASERAEIEQKVVRELRLRRKRYVDPTTPIGILLHHLMHDDAIWAVTDELIGVLQAHPATTFLPLGEIMPAREATAPDPIGPTERSLVSA